jgi:hypothetical protein
LARLFNESLVRTSSFEESLSNFVFILGKLPRSVANHYVPIIDVKYVNVNAVIIILIEYRSGLEKQDENVLSKNRAVIISITIISTGI